MKDWEKVVKRSKMIDAGVDPEVATKRVYGGNYHYFSIDLKPVGFFRRVFRGIKEWGMVDVPSGHPGVPEARFKPLLKIFNEIKEWIGKS